MPRSVLDRHGLTVQTRRVLHETFANASEKGLPEWRLIGAPVIRRLRLAGVGGIELAANAGAGGIERELDARALAGRTARIELRYACTSARRVEALATARITISARRGERDQVISLPLLADVAPGWESQVWNVGFAPDLTSAAVRIEITQAGAAIFIGRLDVFATEPDPGLASRPGTGSLNMVPDGDFETRQAKFFASSVRNWPNSEECRLPLSWELTEDAALGRTALALKISGNGRIGFGPMLSAAVPAEYALSFHARSQRPASLTAFLRDENGVIAERRFVLTRGWQRHSATLKAEETVAGRIGQAANLLELTLDFTSDSEDVETNVCGLDAVVLTPAATADDATSVRSAPIEIGLTAFNSTAATRPAESAPPLPKSDGDLCNLFDEGEPLAVDIRLVADSGPPERKLEATLALDLLDAWDRVVWTRTNTASVPADGRFGDVVQFQLPRGYYRLLASLWTAQPGESELISRAALQFGVVSLGDPVPVDAIYGLSAEGGAISARSTQLGVGWVRVDVPVRRVQTAAGQWDFTLCRSLFEAAGRAELEAICAMTLPAAGTRQILQSWLQPDMVLPAAVIIRPAPVSRQPVAGKGDEMAVAEVMLASADGAILPVREVSTLGSAMELAGSGETIAIVCPWKAIPEANESILTKAAELRQRGVRIWDSSVTVSLGGAPRLRESAPMRSSGDAAWLLPETLDPVRSASRMVRSLLIRGICGAERVGCEALALAPVQSCFEDSRRWLHETDLSPRVAAVALDAMTSLLNDAALVRWIDLPGGARMLYYDKDQGGAVVVFWRSFGLSATKVSLGVLPAGIRLLDLTGTPQPPPSRPDAWVLEINDIVQYLVASPEDREALWRALDAARIEGME